MSSSASFLAYLVSLIAFRPDAGDEAMIHSKPVLPVFKPRFWWSPDRLDVRPVLWSMRNKPEDWAVQRLPRPRFDGGWMLHTPSQHSFQVGGFWAGDRAGLRNSRNCGCSQSSKKFHTGQAHRFNRMAWKFFRAEGARQGVAVAKEFHSHFVK